MFGDGQGVAILPVAELELAFVVGAPEFVGGDPSRERGPGRAMTGSAKDLDQLMSMQNGVDRTFGGNTDVTVEPPNQNFTNFASAPMRLLALHRQDQALDLVWQLVRITDRPTAAIPSAPQTRVLYSDRRSCNRSFSRCRTRDNVRHRFAVQQSRHKP